jgi:hypothetical protein
MKSTSTWLSAAILAATCLTSGSAQAQSQPQAQPQPQALRLREIKDLDTFDPNWIMTLCTLPGLDCNKVEVPRLFERKSESGAEYYAVLEGLVLARLVRQAPGPWQLLNRWSFADYPLVPRRDEATGSYSQIDMHPALYPAGPELWAIAVLTTVIESYSGGGATFRKADFVVLDRTSSDIGEKHKLFEGVPFSCRKTVRACFSEQDHRSSKQCHDESSGYLTLNVSPSSSASFYEWTATWHETVLAGGKPKTTAAKTQTPALLRSGVKGAGTDAFPFCRGGPIE